MNEEDQPITNSTTSTATSTATPPFSAEKPQEPSSRLPLRAVGLFVILAVVVAWQWYDTRSQIEGLQQELGRKLAEAGASGKESRNLASEAREAGRQAEGKLLLLEAKLAESQSQQLALEALYQEVARNRDEVTLEEVEQLLLIASQQLHLASGVKSALIAMQGADSRLQRIDRPQLSPLRKVILKDIDLLKSARYVDTVGISLRLDNLATSVETLPLAMEIRPPKAQPVPGTAPVEQDLWLNFAREIWGDMKQLVRIQNMNRPDLPLLAPSQSYFLRENLKLRLLSARHALLVRDPVSFKADVKACL